MSETDSEYRKLCWRSRRGMLELDQRLIPFVQSAYLELSVDNQQRYKQLLNCEDTDLLDWLIYRVKPSDADLAHIVDIILNYVQSSSL